MPSFGVDKEEVTAFHLGDKYLFTAYFDEDSLFEQLKSYYSSDQYRFEIPEGELEDVQQILDEFFYKLVIEENLSDYCVVIERDTDSSDILRSSVMREQWRQYDVFLMKDKLSVEQAVEHGGTRLKKSRVNMENLQWKTNGS
jgi:hypothetical protein